jgi:hypothetical protein
LRILLRILKQETLAGRKDEPQARKTAARR